MKSPYEESPVNLEPPASTMKTPSPSIEPLEARIAPASLTFLDADGDRITITVSKGPALAVGANVTLSSGSAATPGVLQKLTLTDPLFAGASVSFAVKKAAGGDGLVNVGFIDAGSNDLGTVTVPGDLGRIVCGDLNMGKDVGLAALKVRSMGALGTLTQAGGTLLSVIVGALGRLEVTRDFIEAHLETTDPISNTAGIGKIVIGGDLVGGDAAESGRIEVDGNVGSVTIRGKMVGGEGEDSGSVRIADDLGAGTFGGLVGGRGKKSGRVEMHGPKAAVLIKGSVIGGLGEDSGALECEGDIGTVTITGAILGGAGTQSGRLDLDAFKQVTVGSIASVPGDENGQVSGRAGAVFVRGNVVNGGSFNGANIEGNGDLAAVTIGGDLQGSVGATGRIGTLAIRGNIAGGNIGAGSLGLLKIDGNFGSGDAFSDSMFVGDVAKIVIGGSLIGGGNQCGRIESTGKISELIIRGSVVGGDSDSGYVLAAEIGKLTIGGDIKGGSGNGLSGVIKVNGALGPVTVGRSIIGGGGADSGRISATGIGPVTIGGDIVGGSGSGSGLVDSFLGIGKMRVKGSLLGGLVADSGKITAGGGISELIIDGSVHGSGFASTGIISTLHLGRVTIGGDLVGGDFGAGTTRGDSGLITAGEIDSVTIRGNLIAGGDATTNPPAGASGAIIAGTIGPVVIHGSIIGNDTNHALLVARGQQVKPGTGDDLAIAALTVRGDVQFAEVLGGFTGFNKVSANADASIGPVTVGGDWRASSLVAGAQDAGAPGFGLGDRLQSVANTALIARLVRITIGGDVLGTAQVGNDHFGFVAERIEAIAIAGRKITLDPGTTLNDNVLLAPTGDLRALEVDP